MLYKKGFDSNVDAILRLVHGSGGLLGVLALVLAGGSSAALGSSVEDLLPVLVHLELDDADLGRVEADVDGGTVSLLALDSLNVDCELLAVDLHDLADLLAFEVSAQNLDLVVLTDGHGPEIGNNVLFF
jgi:hypothetical protein